MLLCLKLSDGPHARRLPTDRKLCVCVCVLNMKAPQILFSEASRKSFICCAVDVSPPRRLCLCHFLFPRSPSCWKRGFLRLKAGARRAIRLEPDPRFERLISGNSALWCRYVTGGWSQAPVPGSSQGGAINQWFIPSLTSTVSRSPLLFVQRLNPVVGKRWSCSRVQVQDLFPPSTQAQTSEEI